MAKYIKVRDKGTVFRDMWNGVDTSKKCFEEPKRHIEASKLRLRRDMTINPKNPPSDYKQVELILHRGKKQSNKSGFRPVNRSGSKTMNDFWDMIGDSLEDNLRDAGVFK